MSLAGMVLGVAGVGASDAAGAPVAGAMLVTQLDLRRPGRAVAGTLRAQYGDAARLCVVSGGRRTRGLAEGFHSACDPAVSFDAKRVLFAGKRKAADGWNIYEIAVDGSGLRQITRNAGNCRSPSYQSKLYTIVSSEPWYQITFVSDAAGARNEHGAAPATDLYSCKLDGTDVRRLTYNPSSDMDPFLMADGRLLFAAWQRSTAARGAVSALPCGSRLSLGSLKRRSTAGGRVGLFGIGIDGTDYAVFAADEGRRVKHMPVATTGGLAVFVEADRVPWDGAGYLSCVRLRRPLHSYRRITKAADGLFHSPSPLPDGHVLVSRRPGDGTGTHGVFRLDPVSGRRETVFDDPQYHDIQATLIHPRGEPDGRSTVVMKKDPRGKLYCLNVYISDLKDRRWMPAGTVRGLRVLEGVPVRVGPASSADRVPRRMLGEIPIAKDGSFNIEVPANTPIELQILDADGLALRTCSWIWARNHEPRGCIGCHEDGELTPENQFQTAFERKPVSLCPPPARRRTVDFGRDVKPIVTAKCVPCHKAGGAAPRLDIPGGWRKYVHPGRARTSPLVWHVYGRNTARGWDGAARERPVKPIPPGKEVPPLTAQEKRRLVEWIDLGALPGGMDGEHK